MLHKSCRSSKISDNYCNHCDRFIDSTEIIHINIPLAKCISIIKGQNDILGEMIVNAIGKISHERR